MIIIENLSFYYKDDELNRGITDINLRVKKGECIVLCGKSGCGKSTLLRAINGLIPHFYEGDYTGKVHVADKHIEKVKLESLSTTTGSVFQNPATQFFNVDSTSELAFGCENLGLPVDIIEKRIASVVEIFDIYHLLNRHIFSLSGGEKQQIACASVFATEPEVLIFDEPSASMDSESIGKLTKTINVLKNMNKTIVISEHQLYYLTDVADRYVFMNNGKIERIFSSEEFTSLTDNERQTMGLRRLSPVKIKHPKQDTSDGHFSVSNLVFKRNGKIVLNIPTLKLSKGEVTAVIGKNGVGKSTLAKCLSGLEKAKGQFIFNGKKAKRNHLIEKSFMVMQDVNMQLFTESIYDEVTLLHDTIDDNRVESVLRQLGLWSKRTCHPMSLSGGEKQRLAVASAILSNKEFLIFDEPTSGLDYVSMKQMGELIHKIKSDCICMIITHDLELVEHCCDRVIYLELSKLKST